MGAPRTFVAALTLLTAAALAACSSSDKQSSTFGSGSGSGGAFSGGGAPGGGMSAAGAAGAPLLGAGGEAPACKPTGDACQSSTECCAGNTCNNTSGTPELNGCRLRCTQNSECQTGCCVLFTNDPTKGICGDQKWCACGATGAACSSKLPACCTDQVCLANDATQASYSCHKKCSTSAECPTSCCVPNPNLGGQGVCMDKAIYTTSCLAQ